MLIYDIIISILVGLIIGYIASKLANHSFYERMLNHKIKKINFDMLEINMLVNFNHINQMKLIFEDLRLYWKDLECYDPSLDDIYIIYNNALYGLINSYDNTQIIDIDRKNNFIAIANKIINQLPNYSFKYKHSKIYWTYELITKNFYLFAITCELIAIVGFLWK